MATVVIQQIKYPGIQTQPWTFPWMREEAVQSVAALDPAGSHCRKEQTDRHTLFFIY
ncbi:UNVERIFIED_CONTAM: hypothetical protein FKN15_055740 [Acipenser sinensis]